jgi:hypothetical protein
MKRTVLALAFLSAMMVGQVYAQSTNSTSVNPQGNPGGIYIKGGVNFSNISSSSDGSYRDGNMLTTFNAGVVADLPLATMFSIQPGVVLSGKGAKVSHYYSVGGDVIASDKVKLNPLYIEVPVNFVVKLPITTGTNFFFGAGPYGAIGVGGKYKAEANAGNVDATATHNLKFGNDSNDDLKSFDYGLNALAGLEIDRVMLNINYGYGLAKIVPNSDDNSNDKNKYRVLSVNVGFRF